jgi:signal transduction histidine kinase/CHASE2 domain-containing sensor protein
MTITRKIIILAFSLLALFSLEYLGILSGMNTYFYDLAFRIRGAREPLQRIVVVAIDEKTLEALGRWPLKRSLYASVLERTAAADVVAFDIMMVEPTPDDAALARKMREYGKAVLPISIETGMTIADPAPVFAPLPVGHVHIEQGIDGVVREVYHTLYFQGRRLPSFASRIYEIAGKSSFHRETPFLEQQDAGAIVQGDLMRINYCGGPGTFRQLSFLDVVNGVYPRDYFQGKIVLVGITAMGLVDSATTPYSETRRGAAGVEIQANILNNLFTGNAISVVPLNLRVLIGGVLGLFMYLIFFRIPEGQGAILLTAVLTACSIVVFLLFSRWHIWYGPAGAYLILTTMLALAYIFKLNDAALSLGRTYDAIRPHLRNAQAKEMPQLVGAGLSGILTPRGIQTQAFVLNDITHALIFEKELSDRILMSDIFGVAVFDPDGRLTMANRDIHHLCTANAIPLDSLDRFISGLALHVMEKGTNDAAFEQWLQMTSITAFLARPEKQYLKVDLSLLPVGNKKYALFILSDITKIKEVEILKGQIVSIVSHELKTPMTNIQGFSELLVDGLEGEMRQFAGIILEESVRLTRFVNLFLDINRIEEGRQQIRKAPVQLSALIRQAAFKMQPIAMKKGIHIQAETSDGAGPVMIDKELTEQAILNLAENAVKYSPQEGRVTLRLTDQPEAARIDVEDNGYGIREEDQSRIFEKFYRANAELAEEVKGSGLGLTFVKEAIEAQGGQVAVTSTFGQGSTFSIIFPRTKPGSET